MAAKRALRYRGCPAGNSFTPDTPVVLADGTTKPIKDIGIGDKVLATDPETGETGPRAVIALIDGNGEKQLVDLTIKTGQAQNAKNGSITATEGHPFWVPELHQWVEAGSLKAGQWLQTRSGTWVQISDAKYRVQSTKVYNLTVDDLHTYYVLAGETSVLVHNAGCDEWAAKHAANNGGDIFTFHGPGGKRLPMGPYRPKGPRTPELDESWFHHTVVVRDGKVYDQWAPRGISIDEFKKRFDYGDDIDFGF
ncbi:Hint domain-containing protein [Streptomyces sp. NBC_01435]